MLWLGLAALALTLFAGLVYWLPLSLSSSLQARAEPSGAWVLALGIGIGPIAFSALGARGVPPFLTCHLFGRQLVRLPLSRWLKKPQKNSDQTSPQSRAKSLDLTRIERAIGRFFSNLDLFEAFSSWWGKTSVFEVRSLEMDLQYSFRDVALTGQILAGLCVLSGILPERYVLRHTPGWHSEDRVVVTADGHFRIWPVRLVVNVLGFVLKQKSAARRAMPAKQMTQTP